MLYAIAIVLLGMLYVRACWEPSIRADERRRAGDRSDDSAIARLAAREVEHERAFSRERDSTSRVIANLRSRVRVVHDTVTVYQRAPVDSLVAALDARHRADSLETLFWRAQTAARDSIIPRLQQARDDARRKASRRDHMLTDVGGAALATYGILEKNEFAFAAGAAVIALPRVLDALGRLF